MIDIKEHSLYKPMEVENVLSNIFNIYIKNFWLLFSISFVSIFSIQLIFYYLGFSEIIKMSDPEEIMRFVMSIRKELFIASVVYFIVYGFLISVLINILIRKDIDKSVSIGEIITGSIHKYMIHMIFFLILSVTITVAGAVIGILALFIGFFVALFYLGTVLMPGGALLVAENKNAIEAVGRSFKLAHADFWPSLGVFVIFILIMLVASFIMSAVMAIPLMIAFFDNLKETGSLLEAFNIGNYDIGLWTVVLNSLTAAIIYPLYAILSVVMYFKLRFVEDKKAEIK